MIPRLHAAAGIAGLLTIVVFWLSTAAVELFGSHEAVAAVKRGILWGMLVLVPAMAMAGGSGFRLAAGRGGRLVVAKRRRMPIIALNGIVVLVPCAGYLDGLAQAGAFDTQFYLAQAVELAAGALNIVLMALNMRDGIRVAGTPPSAA